VEEKEIAAGCDSQACSRSCCSEETGNPWPPGTSYITTALFQAPALMGAYALLRKAPLRLPVFAGIWVAIATVVRKVVCCRCEYYGEECSTIMGKWTAMLYEKDEEHPLTAEAFYLDFGLIGASILLPLPQVKKMGKRYLAVYLLTVLLSAAGIRYFACRHCPNTVCFNNPDFSGWKRSARPQ